MPNVWDQFATAPTEAVGDNANVPQSGAVLAMSQNQGSVDSGLRGQDLMQKLEQDSPGMAANVKAVLEGRSQYPSNFFLKSPMGQ
jgi:hypothetical protein